MPSRCPWTGDYAPMIHYHDTEWGVPLHDDCKLFEFMVLDAFQAGLSWRTMIAKRENFRLAFDGFDFSRIADYDDKKFARLMADAGIVRNRLKIEATITNAQAYIKLIENEGSFDRFLWGFVDGKPIINHFETLAEIPASTPLSDRISRELKSRGFRFVDTTIIYAFIQAAGLVNDHLTDCFRYHEVQQYA